MQPINGKSFRPRWRGLGLAYLALLGAALLLSRPAALAVEGSTAAGPLGGTDIRAAQLPPPGFYGGAVGLVSPVNEIRDGNGRPVPGLDAVNLLATMAAPFFLYVPEFKLFEGSVGLLGVFPVGQMCGQLVSAVPRRCTSGLGDPYFEFTWSRSFGKLRPSRDPGALPIFEGLSVSLGLGVVVPIGNYNAQTQAMNGVTIGNNTWDFAPSIAMTYTTPPWIADGTEFSAKLYWNNYLKNPRSRYQASPLLDIDFAITERIGRFQVGVAGFYAFQVADDRQFGGVVGPNGRQMKYLNIGPILNYDIPEWNAALRIKALASVVSQNAVVSKGLLIGFAKKF